VTLRLEERPPARITGTRQALSILKSIYRRLDADCEHFVVLALDHYKQLLGYKVFASGDHNLVRTSARAVFAPAFRFGAHGIVLAHNHPSGKAATRADRKLESRLRKIGASLKIKLHEHIVLTSPVGAPRATRKPWNEDEIEKLVRLAKVGLPATRMRRRLKRSTGEILEKAQELAIQLKGQKIYK
jgi:hypothetical protein